MPARKPIKIDLCDLTEKHLEEALPHMGQCSYASPCIIGTLIPKRKRKRLDEWGSNVEALVEDLDLEFPEGQTGLALRLQKAFDKKSPHIKRTFQSVVAAAQKLKEKAA